MKQLQFVIPWKTGLHLGPAARLVRLAKKSKCVICLKVGDRVADARSILAVLLLCAAAGMIVNCEVDGEDEDEVLTSISSVFDHTDSGHDADSGDFKA